MHACAVAKYSGTHYGTNPNSETNRVLRIKTLLSIDFPFIGSVRRRLGTAGAEGLRGNEALNENNFMVLAVVLRRKGSTQPLSKLVRNVPMLNSLEMSPFCGMSFPLCSVL